MAPVITACAVFRVVVVVMTGGSPSRSLGAGVT